MVRLELAHCERLVGHATTEHPESTVTLFKANGDVLWQAP